MAKAPKCPICKSPVPEGEKARPFCSSRCKDVDLGSWLNESYRIVRPATSWEYQQAFEQEQSKKQDA